jgi:hypothetical protein
MSPPTDDEDNLFNLTNTLNQSNDTYINTESSSKITTTTAKLKLKPSLVETDILKQSLIAKPSPEIDQSDKKLSCNKFFCCYHRNFTNNQNETIINNSFSCQDKDDKQSNDCKDILTYCQTSTLQICLINKTDIRCRIDQICENEKKPDCSIQLIETAIINASTSTTTTTTDLPSTNISTTTIITTTTTAMTTPTTSMF